MIDSRTQFWVILILVCTVNLASLLPILKTPWSGDDHWYYSPVRGLAQLENKNAIEVTWDDLVGAIRGGRWFPMQSYRVLVFYYMDRIVYKATILIFVLMNVAVLGYFIYEITYDEWLSLLAMVLSPLFFQLFRNYHDPLTSYHFVEQVEVLFILMSLLFFLRFLRGRRSLFLIGSLACYTVCLLVYEVSLVFCMLHALTAYKHFGTGHARDVARASLPFFLLAIFNVVITIVIRVVHNPQYGGILPSLDIVAVLRALSHQLYAPLPLTTFFSHPEAYWPPWQYATNCWGGDVLVLAIVWTVLCYLTCRMCISTAEDAGGVRAKDLTIIGLGLWFLPAPLIAMSAKYQEELLGVGMGVGYMPVYISYFGVMMVSTAALSVALGRLKRMQNRAVYVGLGVIVTIGFAIALINFNNNRIDVAKMLSGGTWDSFVLDGAQKSGLLSAVPDGSFLICPWPLDTRSVRMKTGLTLKIVWPAATPGSESTPLRASLVEDTFSRFRKAESTYVFPEDARVFYLKAASADTVSGYAVLARATRLAVNNNSVFAVASDKVYVYWQQPCICSRRERVAVEVVGSYVDRRSLKKAGAFKIERERLKQLHAGPSGSVFELPASGHNEYFDPISIRVLATSEIWDHSRF
jgi:hypothetical protein